jgi:tetratricopeptide (TPR) repeat protein
LEQLLSSDLSQLAEVRENWKKAEALLRDPLQVTPEDLVDQQRLEHALHARMKVDADVEACFRDALKAAPDDLSIRLEVAKLALQKGKLDIVKEQAEAALRIEAANAKLKPEQRRYSGSHVGRALRGLVALWKKNWPEAEKDFECIILESPNDFGARNNIALVLVEQNDAAKKRRALDFAEANYRDNKNNADALSTLGWVYFRRGEFDQATLALDQAVKASGGNLTNPDTITYVAHSLHHHHREWEAKALLEEILKSDRAFSMKPEAQKLYEKVKDAKKPEPMIRTEK